MLKKFISIIFASQLFLSCGFTPTLKNNNQEIDTLIHYEINPESSYVARKILNANLQSVDKDKAKFLTKITVKEQESAVNVESSGSVNEYKIEVLINFEIFDMLNNVMLLASQSRGFENYDVSSSEYTNSLIQKESLERALIEGIQLMNIIIQSKITE